MAEKKGSQNIMRKKKPKPIHVQAFPGRLTPKKNMWVLLDYYHYYLKVH